MVSVAQCVVGAERTRSRSTPRRNPCTSFLHAQPHGDSFKLLGVSCDCKLRTDLAVSEVVCQASWKMTTILRARRFHGFPQLVQVYTSKVLSCGLSDEAALLHFSLALPEARRGIATLRLLHRSVLGNGPRHVPACSAVGVFQKHEEAPLFAPGPTPSTKCWPALPSDCVDVFKCCLNMWLSRRA